MKIGLISDTHGDLDSFLKIKDKLIKYDIIIHTGDILNHGPKNPIPKGYNPSMLGEEIKNIKVPFVWVKGNCDSEVDKIATNYIYLDPYFFFMYNNIRILATHGDKEYIYNEAKKLNTKIFISGHTHIPHIEEKSGIIYINPGSTSIPRDKFGGSFGEIIIKDMIYINIFEIESQKTIYSEKYFI